MRTALLALPVALVLAVALSACGSTHNTSTAPAPAEPSAPATGSLRTFTYEDTVAPHLLDPFKEANPDLDVKTATFDSDSEAAAKTGRRLPGRRGRSLRRRDQPHLSEQDLLRPLSKKGLPGFDQLTFHDAPGVVDEEGQVLFVPVSAGPQGLIVDTEKVKHVNPSWKALFEPQYKGEVAIEGDESLTPIGEAGAGDGLQEADGTDPGPDREGDRVPEGTQGPVPQLHRI